MQSLEKLKNIFADIKITEEQVEALDEFFEDYKEHLRSEIKEEILMEQEEDKELTPNNTESFISLEEHEAKIKELKQNAEKAFALFEADAEKAFALFESDAEKAFDFFEADAEKAFDLGVKDIQELYSEKTINAIDDLYETIEEKVKNEFLESNEYKAFETIKNTIAPHVLSEEKLAKGYKELLEKYQILQEESKVSERKQIIDSLIEDFPAKEAKIIKEFIESAKDTDEIYERFSTVVALLEEKIENGTTISTQSESISEKVEKPAFGWKKKSRVENLVVEEEEEEDEEDDEDDEEDFEFEDSEEDLEEDLEEDSYEDLEEDSEDESYEEDVKPIFNSKTQEGKKQEKSELSNFKPHEQEVLKKAFNW